MCRPSVVTWFSLLSLLCALPATRGVAQDASPSVEVAVEAPATPPGVEPVSGDVTPSTQSEGSSEVPSPTGSVTTHLAAPHEPAVAVAEIAETVPEVVVDPTPPVAVAWGRGLTFHSDDDRFSLQIRGRLQAQAFVESGVSDGDPASVDFLVRRARLVFRGHLLDANLEYYVQLGLAPRDMEPDLLIPVRDAQIAWTGLRDMNVRVGVMKVPFSRERVISSSSLQLVDRSIVNAELAVDRDNGVQLYSNDLFGLGGYLGYQLGVFGGDGRLRVNNDLGLLYVARVQVQPFGRFDDSYIESDLTREERLRLSIGVGFAYNEDTNRRRRTTTDFYQLARFSYFHGEADLILKYAGFSLQAELLLRQVDGAASATNLDAQGMEIVETSGSALGWFVQAGYLFDFAPVEIAARVADIYPQGPSAVHASREVTVGFSWYPMGHDLKLQLDGSYLSTARESMGVTSLTERFQGRLQVQAYF